MTLLSPKDQFPTSRPVTMVMETVLTRMVLMEEAGMMTVTMVWFLPKLLESPLALHRPQALLPLPLSLPATTVANANFRMFGRSFPSATPGPTLRRALEADLEIQMVAAVWLA
jgi:hypothetical protein